MVCCSTAGSFGAAHSSWQNELHSAASAAFGQAKIGIDVTLERAFNSLTPPSVDAADCIMTPGEAACSVKQTDNTDEIRERGWKRWKVALQLLGYTLATLAIIPSFVSLYDRQAAEPPTIDAASFSQATVGVLQHLSALNVTGSGCSICAAVEEVSRRDSADPAVAPPRITVRIARSLLAASV